jgi:acyl-CoA thioester hydrolase
MTTGRESAATVEAPGSLRTTPQDLSLWQERLGRDLSAFPHHRRLQTRVSDLDGYGHLNAIRLGHLYEDARAAFHLALGRGEGRVLVAQLTFRYLAEGQWPDEAQIGTGIVRVGGSSFVMGQGLFQAGRCIGLCETVLVNTGAGGASPLSDDYRRVLRQHRLISASPA